MKNLIEELIKNEINDIELKEKLTGHLVKKQKRGTFQALKECAELEEKIKTDLLEYMNSWFVQEICHGKIKEEILKEFREQLGLELIRRGFNIQIIYK